MFNAKSMNSDTENVEYGVQIQETFTYPLNNNILYQKYVNQKTKYNFSYIIIKEDIYSDKIIIRLNNKQKERTETLQDTSNIRRKRQSKQYKILHGYVVETTWEQAADKQTVCCKIDYIDEIPQFHIKYDPNFQYVISLTKSLSNIALIYERVSI